MWFFKILEFRKISAIFGPVAAIFRPFDGIPVLESKSLFQSDPMIGRGSKWPKSFKMAKNRQNRAFYAKISTFDYFIGKFREKCVIF